MSQYECPIIILAAGASSRMRGRDKLLEDIDGSSLLRRQVNVALHAKIGPVYVALPVSPHPRYTVLQGADVQIISVVDAQEGMGASLRTAFAALPSQAQCAMLLLADLPDLEVSDLQKIHGAIDLDGPALIWRGITQEGAPGHPIVFHNNLFAEFAKLTGDSGGREVVAVAQGHVVHVALSGNRARNDLDTPEEWANWRAKRDLNGS
ncbi:MAG: nucleotidyltransferase family protein [Sulfitobacter sp.]